MKYGLSNKQLTQITDFIKGFPEVEEAVLFGSRAIDTFKEASDVDIAIKGEKVTLALAAKMKTDIEEDSFLPFFFDFIAYPTITNEELKEHIDRKGVVIFKRGINEWKECHLAEIAKYTTGKLNSNAEVVDGKYPFFTCSPSTLKIDSYAFDTEALILAGNNANGVFSLKYYNGKFNAYQRTYIINVNDKELTDYKFLFYSLQQQLSNLEFISHGTATKFLTLPIINSIPVSLPPLPEQRAIASVLSSLDDKIDLLHRQNKTLEAMAETLFRQWFIEEEENCKSITISEMVEFNPQRKLVKGTVAPYLDMANVNTSAFHPESWYDREFNSGSKFINGDTLLARITPCLENGKASHVTFLEENQIGWGSTEFIVLHSKPFLHSFFTYVLAKNIDFRDYAEGCLEGSSGRQRVNVEHLMNFEINEPSQKIIEKFNDFATAIVPKLNYNFKQIRNLEKLRDTLLPKLMSGEVRVIV